MRSSDQDAAGSAAKSELIDKRNTSAAVWKHFGFEANEAGRPRLPDRPRCRVCSQDVLAKHGNTSNLYSHLKNRHPEVYSRLEKRPKTGHNRPAGQPSLSEAWRNTQMLPSSSREHKELTKAVTYCLTKDMLPISTVDKAGFKAMLRRFNPRYQLPTCSRNYFTRVSIPVLVTEVRSAMELKIASGELEFFSGTTDLWTSTAGHPYLTFTCHFIDHSWELQSFCLHTHYMPEDHTAVNIQEALSEGLQQWKLAESQLVGITTDSGSNVKLACELLNWTRLSCFGHNLNLAVEKGLNDSRVNRAIRLCKSVVATFSRSPKKQRDLRTVQEQKGLPAHRLKSDVVTRWGSSYEMVERLIEQMEAIRVVLASDRKTSHLIPSWQDCDVLDSLSAALKPLKEMTDALSGEKCVTVSAIKPLLSHLTSVVLVDKQGDTGLTKEIKERVKVDLEIQYSNPELSQLLELSSFLDPRFKLAYVSDRESMLKDVEEQMCGASDDASDGEDGSNGTSGGDGP